MNTLKIIGHAPIFDNGTSMWNGIATSFIRSSGAQESRPFRKDHEKQIKLVTKSRKFESIDVDIIVDSIMSLSPYVETSRVQRISNSLKSRWESLGDL